jgi:hypothetical protein
LIVELRGAALLLQPIALALRVGLLQAPLLVELLIAALLVELLGSALLIEALGVELLVQLAVFEAALIEARPSLCRLGAARRRTAYTGIDRTRDARTAAEL